MTDAALEFADLSSNNPIPDLAVYKAAGHTHIEFKVSEGTGYYWAEFGPLADAAHAHGLTVGHYHWLRPDSDAAAQAAFFNAHLASHAKPGDLIKVDYEPTYDNGVLVPDGSDAARAQQLATFTAKVHAAHPGLPIVVYVGNYYLDGKPIMQAAARRWPAWIADYDNVAAPPNPHGLSIVGWQFTDHATVPGISAPVDFNRWISTGPLTTDTSTAHPLGGFMSDLTPAQQLEVLHGIRTLVEGGVAEGQTTVGGTIAANTRATQAVVNILRAIATTVTKIAADVAAIRKKVGA